MPHVRVTLIATGPEAKSARSKWRLTREGPGPVLTGHVNVQEIDDFTKWCTEHGLAPNIEAPIEKGT